MQHLKEIVLPNYPLVLSLLKYRNVWVFWKQKNSFIKFRQPLTLQVASFVKCLDVISILLFKGLHLLEPDFFVPKYPHIPIFK